MRNASRTIILAAAGAVLLLAGCTKGGYYAGRQIRFGVSSGSATKASYGADNAAHTKQAIDWAEGDGIVITCAEATVTNSEDAHVAKYQVATVTQTGSADDVVSKGQLELADANGFEWPDEDPAGGYTFYAAYPSTLSLGTDGTVTASITTPNLTKGDDKTVYIGTDGKITYDETETSCAYKVYEPDVKQFVLTSKTAVEASGSGVTLSFDPAFTAIEFNVTSADDDFTLTKAELIASGSDYLTGQFTMTAGNLATAAVADASKMTANQTIAVTLNDGITQEKGVTFTLFTLPVTNTNAYKLRLTTNDGQTATLTLNKADKTAFPFQAGQKYRINLLKLGGQWKYAIEFQGTYYQWDGQENDTKFSDNVACSKLNVKSGATRDKTAEAAIPSTDARYGNRIWYMNLSGAEKVIVVTFTPSGPLGGYWNFVPTYYDSESANHFKVTVVDSELNESSDLYGQIMNREVTLYIRPVDIDNIGDNRYTLYFKTFASPSPTLEPSYSMDSETQHQDSNNTAIGYYEFIIAN